MERVLEPELMTDPAQAKAYAEADFAASDEAFVTTFLTRFGDLLCDGCDGPGGELAGPIVDLGCGPGNITLRLGQALPGREIVGIDGSSAMLALARLRVRPDAMVRFVQARLPSEALAPRAFSAVLSNSLLHHLPDPGVLWQSVARIAAPGAPVWIADLRRPPTSEDAQALVDRYAAGEPELLRRDFQASLHAAFEPDEVRAQIAAAGLDLRVEALGDRYLLAYGHAGKRGEASQAC
jgi:SAM-dependent methyltransferase